MLSNKTRKFLFRNWFRLISKITSANYSEVAKHLVCRETKDIEILKMFFFSVTASFTLLFVGFEIYSPDAEGKLQNNSPKRPTSASRVQNHYYYCYGSGRGKDILKFLVDLKKEMKGELDQLTKTVANFRMGFKEVIQKHEKQLSQVDQRLESFDKQVNSSHAELKLNQDRILHKISGNFVNLKKELLHIKQKCGSCARGKSLVVIRK